jgi:hypothetical protein
MGGGNAPPLKLPDVLEQRVAVPSRDAGGVDVYHSDLVLRALGGDYGHSRAADVAGADTEDFLCEVHLFSPFGFHSQNPKYHTVIDYLYIIISSLVLIYLLCFAVYYQKQFFGSFDLNNALLKIFCVSCYNIIHISINRRHLYYRVFKIIYF